MSMCFLRLGKNCFLQQGPWSCRKKKYTPKFAYPNFPHLNTDIMADTRDENNSIAGSNYSPNQTNNDETNNFQCNSKQFYVSKGRSLKALAILWEGMIDKDGELLVDPSILPYSSVRKSSDIKPSAIELRTKVMHHFTIDSNNILIAPCPKAWFTSCACDWLNQHPITGDNDIVFIKETNAECIKAAEIAAKDKAQEERDLATSEAIWTWKYPMLWLIHALINHDDIKRAFHIGQNLPSGRMEVSLAANFTQVEWSTILAHHGSTATCPFWILPTNYFGIWFCESRATRYSR